MLNFCKSSRLTVVKNRVLYIMLHAPLLLSLFARERGFYGFPGFCCSRIKHSIAWKGIITSCASGLFKLAMLKFVLNCCLINMDMNKHLMTDMADANGLQRAIRPTGFFNIKKMAADFCSAQLGIMDNTASLKSKE